MLEKPNNLVGPECGMPYSICDVICIMMPVRARIRFVFDFTISSCLQSYDFKFCISKNAEWGVKVAVI